MLIKQFNRLFNPRFHPIGYSFSATKKSIGIPSFQNYRFIDSINKYLEEKQVSTPSPVQQLVYQHFMVTKQKTEACFIGGPTGSGKTLAYLLPLIQELKIEEEKMDTMFKLPNRPRIIVLAPSKELIDQIYGVAKEVSHYSKVKVEKIDVARSWKKNAEHLKDGVDVLVTNLNKLQRLIGENKIILSNVSHIVIDEADVFIECGDEEAMQDLIKYVADCEDGSSQTKFSFVSATLTKKLKIFMDTVFDKKIKYLVTDDSYVNLANIEHEFYHVGDENRLEVLKRQLTAMYKKKPESYMIVFCNSVAACRAVDYYLKKEGFNAGALHGEMPSRLRYDVYKSFRDKKMKILVTSDLGARGLDFAFLDCVINFDFPKSVNDYIHRAGRTGRIGNKGLVVSLYYNKNLSMVTQLGDSYKQKLPLDLTQSSYALKNKEAAREVQEKPSVLPKEYIEFANKHKEKDSGKHILSKGQKRALRNKTRPDFQVKKVKTLRKAIKSVEKVDPQSKRIKYLKREIKRTNKSPPK